MGIVHLTSIVFLEIECGFFIVAVEHLPHEARHVVQQVQGRVKPTMQMAGQQVNDDHGLESEANLMEMKAAQLVTQENVEVLDQTHSSRNLTGKSDHVSEFISAGKKLAASGGAAAILQRKSIESSLPVQLAGEFAAAKQKVKSKQSLTQDDIKLAVTDIIKELIAGKDYRDSDNEKVEDHVNAGLNFQFDADYVAALSTPFAAHCQRKAWQVGGIWCKNQRQPDRRQTGACGQTALGCLS